MPLEFVHSRRGNLELLVNNYIYSLLKNSIARRHISWKCIRCNVTIQTTSTKPSGEIIGSKKPKHPTHAANLDEVRIHQGFSKAFKENRDKKKRLKSLIKIEKYESDDDEISSDSDDSQTSSQTSETDKSSHVKTLTCKTVVDKVLKLNYQWEIENFEDYWWRCQPGESLESPIFSLQDDKQDEWYFQFFPRGTTNNPGNLSMYINLTQKSFNQLPKNFLAGGISVAINFGGIENPATPSLLIKKCSEKEFACVLDSKTVNYCKMFSTWCVGGTLYITAEIIAKTCVQKIYEEELKARADLWRGKNILITFDVDGKKFKANRVHFEEASPVFRELITKQLTIKNVQSIVKITDVKAEIFGQIFDFINNSQQFSLNQSLVQELLLVADVFKLNKLKKYCEKYICRNLTADNAEKALLLARQANADKLKEEALYFIDAKKTSNS